MESNDQESSTERTSGVTSSEQLCEPQLPQKIPSRDGSSSRSSTEGSSPGQYVVPPPTPGAYMNMSSFEADTQPYIPPEFLRIPTGSTIGDPYSILHESGRFYHGYKAGKYLVPNDGAEQDRLDLQHAALMLMFEDRLHLAPVSSPQYVLDVATGTGIWAIEFAQRHPDCHVYGTDLSAIQPSGVVPNCTFLVEDAEEDEWLHGHPHNYDFIHLRAVFSCFDKPKKVISNCYQNMSPGGWIEYQDAIPLPGSMDNNLEGTAWKRFWDTWTSGLRKTGRDIRVTTHLKKWLKEAGFVDVVEKKMILPGGPWPSDPRLKRCGTFMQEALYNGLRGIAYEPMKKAGLMPAEIENLTIEAQESMLDRALRWFWPFYVVYGRKPLDGEIKDSGGDAAIPAN